ncbi:MAG: DUF3868 domain-containing protein [Paramuribaculum sp.]|nr:DUF3868 domain-containing protein [Paramuribaculum sp.]
MKTLRYILALCGAAVTGAAFAQTSVSLELPVSDLSVTRSATDSLQVAMNIDASAVKLSSSREVILTPVASDSIGNEVYFPSLYLAGRDRYYLHLRENDIKSSDRMQRAGKLGVVAYSSAVPFSQWMEQNPVDVKLIADLRGCSCAPVESIDTFIATVDFRPPVPEIIEFTPEFIIMTPVAEVEKTRELKGQAFIDFPVNRTELNPDYRGNRNEIEKILKSIDFIINDPEASIKAITIKGYASPEGSYANNVRLAKGRTATLADYVQTLYSFDPTLIATAYEPEDWEGLRNYVVSDTTLANREKILAIIDSDLAPDPKDNKIRSTYPTQYKFLLTNVYPALRHSDYKIQYVVRTFTDVNEIARVMRTEPNKLSLNELYVLGLTYDPASPEYQEVFELAANLYPTDPVANVNAAAITLRRGELDRAARFLEKAGDSDEARYYRGVYKGMSGDYDGAIAIFEQLAPVNAAAAAALDNIKEVKNSVELRSSSKYRNN